MGLLNIFKKKNLAPASQEVKAPKTKREHIRVAGTSFRQKEIKSLGEHNDDYDLTKRELREDFEGDRVYELDFDVLAQLVPEPENEHDRNAVAVVADDVCIGYIPKKDSKRVRALITTGKIKRVRADISGGKYKLVDSSGELMKDECDFRAEIALDILIDEE